MLIPLHFPCLCLFLPLLQFLLYFRLSLVTFRPPKSLTDDRHCEFILLDAEFREIVLSFIQTDWPL